MRGEVGDAADIPVEQVDVEEKELTGQECIDQYPELWQQFSKLYDDTRKAVDQEAQEQGIPGEVLNDKAEEVVEGDADRQVTRSMSRKEALVGMLAMVSIAELPPQLLDGRLQSVSGFHNGTGNGFGRTTKRCDRRLQDGGLGDTRARYNGHD